MTKDEFIAKMHRTNPEDFFDIDSIPMQIADTEVYTQWFHHVVDNSVLPGDIAFAAIPRSFITDDLRRTAIRESVSALDHISPGDTEGYEDLLFYALEQSPSAFRMMDNSFKTVEFLAALVERLPRVFDMKHRAQDWVATLMTPGMREAVLKTNAWFALSLPEDQVTWDHWRHLCKSDMQCPSALNDAGRLDLFSRFLGEGSWPELDPEVIAIKKIEDIAELAGLVMEIPDHYYEYLLYKAKLMSFPLKDVVTALDKAPMADLLRDLYPDDALRPFMRHNRALRGLLLENDLGM